MAHPYRTRAIASAQVKTDAIDAHTRELAAFAGLVPTTYASGGRTSHGGLMKQSNKWLRWALVEAAWVAVRYDPYFRTLFERRVKHKGPKTAIVTAAQRV